MTKKELSQLYYLNREIEQHKYTLRQLKTGATCCIPPLMSATNFTESVQITENRLLTCMEEYNRLHRFIDSVNDSLIRQILICRYVCVMDWENTVASVGGGSSSASLRMMLGRFLNSAQI